MNLQLLILCVFQSLLSFTLAWKNRQCYINDFGKLDDTLKSCSIGFDHRVKRTIRSVVISACDTTSLPTLVEQTPDVSHVHIHPNASSIDYTRLCDWKYLFKLQMDGHVMTKLPSHFLKKCQNLKFLSMWSHKLDDIAKDAFAGMLELDYLSLRRNEIKQLHKDTFKSLPELKYLYLEMNRLQIIDSDLFYHNPKLETVNLNSNDLKTVGYGAFRMMPVYSNLFIVNNPHLEEIDLTNISNGGRNASRIQYGGFGSNVYLGSCGLKKLFIPVDVRNVHASGNRMTSIDANQHNNVYYLDVSNNTLSGFGNITLPSVNVINVLHNRFMSFSEFYAFKTLYTIMFDLDPKQTFSVDEIKKELPLLLSVHLLSPGMSAEQQQQIVNNFKRHDIQCTFESSGTVF